MNKNLNTSVVVIGFCINLFLSGASYFKALSDIREELKDSLFKQTEKLRDESRNLFASKEETSFIRGSLIEIKSDLKEIKSKQGNK